VLLAKFVVVSFLKTRYFQKFQKSIQSAQQRSISKKWTPEQSGINSVEGVLWASVQGRYWMSKTGERCQRRVQEGDVRCKYIALGVIFTFSFGFVLKKLRLSILGF
jgi:hypothetical protein